MSFFEELKRRNIFRVGLAYAVAAWLLLQLSDILVPLLNLPESAQRFVLLILIIKLLYTDVRLCILCKFFRINI